MRRRIADEEIFLGGFFNTRFSLLGRTDRLFVAGGFRSPEASPQLVTASLRRRRDFLSWPKRLSAQCRGCHGFSETTTKS